MVLAIFAPLTHERPVIAPIYGLIGATPLWEIRECCEEHIAALIIACGGDPYLTLLTNAIDSWEKRTLLDREVDMFCVVTYGFQQYCRIESKSEEGGSTN